MSDDKPTASEAIRNAGLGTSMFGKPPARPPAEASPSAPASPPRASAAAPAKPRPPAKPRARSDWTNIHVGLPDETARLLRSTAERDGVPQAHVAAAAVEAFPKKLVRPPKPAHSSGLPGAAAAPSLPAPPGAYNVGIRVTEEQREWFLRKRDDVDPGLSLRRFVGAAIIHYLTPGEGNGD